jgi:hypothetical protein
MKNVIRWFRDLFVGIGLHWKRTLFEFAAAFSLIWTIVEGSAYLLQLQPPKDWRLFWATLGGSLFAALWRSWRPRSVVFKIDHTNTKIKLSFGDLFEQNGLRAVSVNEFFDSALGKVVSDQSLHGILLTRCFGGLPAAFDKELERELAACAGEDVQRTEGKTRRYPIGTTALIKSNQDKYLLFALARTDPATHKASSDVGTMWEAMKALWRRARNECGGDGIHVALIGSGLSGIGIPNRELLNLIILSAITETKLGRITDEIHIVLRQTLFDEIDLREIEKHWTN